MAIDYGKNNRKTIFGSSQVLTQEEEIELAPVSYTHLTLPTKA